MKKILYVLSFLLALVLSSCVTKSSTNDNASTSDISVTSDTTNTPVDSIVIDSAQ